MDTNQILFMAGGFSIAATVVLATPMWSAVRHVLLALSLYGWWVVTLLMIVRSVGKSS